MKKRTRYLSIGGILLVTCLGVIGGGSFLEKEESSVEEKPIVIDEKLINKNSNSEDEMVYAKAITNVYKASKEFEYVDNSGTIHTPKIDEKLEKKMNIKNHPLPKGKKNEIDPNMTSILTEVLSRTDGSSNNTTDTAFQVVEEEIFKKWSNTFEEWTKGKISKSEFIQKWEEEQAKSNFSGLSKPIVVLYSFQYSKSTLEMIDSVLKVLQKKGASTAPHISFVAVTFDNNTSAYSIYFAESHIE